MEITTKAIILAGVKYNEKDIIIKAFTEKNGFVSYFIKGFFGKQKNKKLKKAYFQPGTFLELVTKLKNNEKLNYIIDARIYYHYHNLYQDYNKLNVATFLRDVLIESLKNEQDNNSIYQFIEKEFIQLDREIFHPDFHIFFIIKLSGYLGFLPDYQSHGSYFDLINGIFTSKKPAGNYLSPAEALIFKDYLGMIFAIKKGKKFSSAERKKIINFLMKYYQLHIAQFTIPKSIDILHQIYG